MGWIPPKEERMSSGAKGQFQFLHETTPNFPMYKVKFYADHARRALTTEWGLSQQFQELSSKFFGRLVTFRVEVVLMVALALLEFSMDVMRHKYGLPEDK